MSRFFRLGLRSSNLKSVLMLGLIADILGQRIDGRGQVGGAIGIRTKSTVLLIRQRSGGPRAAQEFLS